MLEVSDERGRELRALHKERGGTDEGSTESKPATKKKAKKKVDAFAKTGAVTSGPGKINGNGKAQPNKTAKTSAEDAPTAVPAEDLGGSERDRFTRQVSVLAEGSWTAQGPSARAGGGQQEVAAVNRQRHPDGPAK